MRGHTRPAASPTVFAGVQIAYPLSVPVPKRRKKTNADDDA